MVAGDQVTLDKIPALWRHVIILVLISPLGMVALDLARLIIADGGVRGLDGGALLALLDTFAVAAAGGIVSSVTMYVTPLTRQYGVGSIPADLTEGLRDE